ERNRKPAGTRKADIIRQVQEIDPCVPIWDVIADQHEMATAGKRVGCKDEFDRLFACAEALRSEPKIRRLLEYGSSEVSIFSDDPETGVPVKARLDWLNDDYILDRKTFKQKHGKAIDQSIADTTWYEGYVRQAYFSATMHSLATGRRKPLPVVIAFVESDPPHEVRLKELRPSGPMGPNLYWQRSQVDVRHFCRIWADYMERFGEKPWRPENDIEPLLDEEIRALAY